MGYNTSLTQEKPARWYRAGGSRDMPNMEEEGWHRDIWDDFDDTQEPAWLHFLIVLYCMRCISAGSLPVGISHGTVEA